MEGLQSMDMSPIHSEVDGLLLNGLNSLAPFQWLNYHCVFGLL